MADEAGESVVENVTSDAMVTNDTIMSEGIENASSVAENGSAGADAVITNDTTLDETGFALPALQVATVTG